MSAFTRVIHVDPAARTAVVGGMTTYEDLCDATLPHHLMPLVVPQLKTITLGGAVTGLGIESSSLWNGLPHESVTEMEILTGDGRVVIATKDNEHSDLFYGFPNSYGTLGYSLALTIELDAVKPYVHLRHFAFTDPEELHGRDRPDRGDGELPGPPRRLPRRCRVQRRRAVPDRRRVQRQGALAERLHRPAGLLRSLRTNREDFLTVKDYIWRWDTDWFWCSHAFGVQNKVLGVSGRAGTAAPTSTASWSPTTRSTA